MNIIRKYLNKDKHARKIYAVREGTLKGNFIVYISTTENSLNFLVLPDNDVMSITEKEFEQGVQNKIVDYIEKLPHNVYEICCAQYNESKARNNINRLKQSTTQDSVDS